MKNSMSEISNVNLETYLVSLHTNAEDLVHDYAKLSAMITDLINDYKAYLTGDQKPETGWIFPVAINCKDPECYECPHRVRWKSVYWNPLYRGGRFRSGFIDVDINNSLIKMYGGKRARANVKKILAYKETIDSVLEARSEVRKLMRSTLMKEKETLKKSLRVLEAAVAAQKKLRIMF